MPISQGECFGPYEIISILGAGGMGEVYRAKDKRLNREVAIKILPANLFSDHTRLRRFEQEVRLASNLSHPNIVVIHDVGLKDSIPFIVSELLEGESLRKRISRGPLTIKEALHIAVQIADGLAAAHVAGVVHRDIKPENIVITKGGTAKILDFGLAKSMSPRVGTENDPTEASLTETGVIVGTPNYMSPEQARGEEVLFYSDQFSFGIMFYEMITGQSPFKRPTSVQSLAAIVSEDPPPLDAKKSSLPIKIAIERCLSKDALKRYASTTDLHRELLHYQQNLNDLMNPVLTVEAQHSKRKVPIFFLITLTSLLALFAIGFHFFSSDKPDYSNYRFIPIATGQEFEAFPSWSPDGRSIAYLADVKGLSQVFTKSLDSSVPIQLTDGSEDCGRLFWSPDGSRIFFGRFNANKQKSSHWSVAITGGPSELMCDDCGAITISPDNKKAFLLGSINRQGFQLESSSFPSLNRVKYSLEPIASDRYRGNLAFSPDGTKIGMLATSYKKRELEFWVIPFSKGKPKLVEAISKAADNVLFSWMRDSRHVIITHENHLWNFDTESDRSYPVTFGLGQEVSPSVSPKGNQIAFSTYNEQHDIVEVTTDGRSLRNLLSTSFDERDANWSPIADQFVFVKNNNEIWVRNPIDQSERLIVQPSSFSNVSVTYLFGPRFSPDGKKIAFSRGYRDEPAVWLIPVSGGTPVPVLQEGKRCWFPAWSPDGKWLVFTYEWKTEQYAVAKIRVGSSEEPTILAKDKFCHSLQWPNSEDTITCVERDKGMFRIPSEPANVQLLSKGDYLAHEWDVSGKVIYALRVANKKLELVQINPQTGDATLIMDLGEAKIGDDLPASTSGISLSRDQNTFAISPNRINSDLWMIEMPAKKGFWQQMLRVE